MAVVRDILARKGGDVVTVVPETTVFDAAVCMNDHGIGAVVVVDRERLVGVFTERDILKRVVAQRRDPAETRVEEVMTTQVVCCRLDTSLEEVGGVMKNRRIRHVPVVSDEDRLVGMISIGDLNAQHETEQEQTIYLLHEYIAGHV